MDFDPFRNPLRLNISYRFRWLRNPEYSNIFRNCRTPYSDRDRTFHIPYIRYSLYRIIRISALTFFNLVSFFSIIPQNGKKSIKKFKKVKTFVCIFVKSML